MLKVFIGDRQKSIEAAAKYLDQAVADGAELSIFDDLASLEAIVPLVENENLFGGSAAVRLDQVFLNDSIRVALLNRLPVIVESKNVFALIEEKIDAETLSKIKDAGGTVVKAEAVKKAGPKFNVFSLSDSFAARDKKELWTRLAEALEAGESAEAIAGIIFWQLKTMLLTSSGDTAGLNPFVASKAKNALRNYSKEETRKLAFRLISLYHDGHRGKGDLAESLERMVLSL